MEGWEGVVREIVELMEEHRWLHQHRVTDFFKEQLFNKFPQNWKNPLSQLSIQELNSLPLGYYKDEWPASLKAFMHKCHKIASEMHSSDGEIELEKESELHKNPGLTLKKLHEINQMVKVLGKICQSSNCGHIIDVGAGLGHLDFHLSSHLPVKVLGLEQDQAMVLKANAKACESSAVRLVKLKLGEDSMEELEHVIRETHEDHPTLITGLHCCGDLSINVIHSFIQLPSIHHLVLLSCCYHSMLHTDDTKQTFRNFPLSDKCKEILHQSTNQSEPINQHFITNQLEPVNQPLINVCSLRLACQQSRASWMNQTEEEHKRHSLNVAYRALLEHSISINQIVFTKHRKKLPKIQIDTTFEQYLNSIVDRSSINEDQAKTIFSDYEAYKDAIEFIEPFTALQVMLQPLIEHLLLVDRMAYIRQLGQQCNLLNIFNDALSPRNCAIIAHKRVS